MPTSGISSRRRNSFATSDVLRTTSYETPSRSTSRTGGTLSPPLSSAASTGYASSTVTGPGAGTKVNIVTRVAIEGKAKPGKDGAGVNMYLKLSVPLDSVSPGQTIQLFPEENVKILDYIVHPLDNNSAPYNFDSMNTPLLHSAGRALNLPARSQQTFQAAFGLSSPPSSSSSTPLTSSSPRPPKSAANGSSSHPDSIDSVDPIYTGHILVSGYHVSFVLPKVLPPRYPEDGSGTNSVRASGKYGGRRLSIGDRDRLQAQFVAAIELWVPFISQPPRSPFLLSIPTPRCLHNNIKLRIFPPTTNNTSASLASLSSLDDDSAGSWDLASDPHVTRAATSTRSRASSNGYGHNSYHGNEADDESSDSSTAGFSYGCGIQGSFPSTERIRMRWAKPVKNLDIPRYGYGRDNMEISIVDTGRRRVGVKSAKGEMVCIVKGKTRNSDGAEGIIMDVEYKGTCKDVWYPGVATLLGMDISLEAKNSDVSWFHGEGSPGLGWEVAGGSGYTGFAAGNDSNPRAAGGRFDSTESSSSSPQIQITPSPSGASSSYPSRQNSNTSSSSSLLRAPLPGIQNVAEYSFERANATNDPAASITSTQMSTSSMGSLPTSANLTESVVSRPPGYPITLHLNMNELVPPAKNELNFSVKGTVVVVPRARHTTLRVNGSAKRGHGLDAESDDTTSASGGDEREVVPVTLPRFTVLAADTESTSIVVRNDISGTSSSPASVEVYNPNGDIHSDAQARKTVLQKGGFTRCGEGGGRIVIKMPSSGYANGHAGGRYLQAPTTTRSPNDSGRNSPVPRVNPAKYHNTPKLRPKRDGELMIPWVDARITLLSSGFESSSYAVRVRLPAPAEMKGDGDWLEFGLAKSGFSGSSPSSSCTVAGSDRPPDLDIVGVSVDGVPVKFEATAAAPAKEDSLGGIGFEQMSTREWINWVRVRVGGVGGGEVTIDYVVKDQESDRKKGKRRADVGVPIDVYLPTFSLPVGRFEALVEGQRDMKLSSLQTNFRYSVPLESSGNRLLSYAAEPFFYPRVTFFANPCPRSSSRSVSLLTVSLILGLFFFGFAGLYQVHTELAKLNRSPNNLRHMWNPVSQWDHNHSDQVTVTTTATATSTTTVYASPPSQSHWDWFGVGGAEDPGTTSTVITSASTPFSDTASTSPLASLSHSNQAPLESKNDDDDDDDLGQEILSETLSQSFMETFGLIPYQKLMTFTWGDLKPVAESISRVASVVWQYARRAYHYPLDPP